jgi:nucleoid-associated protein YgaU
MSSYVVRIFSPDAALACVAVLALSACERRVEKAEIEPAAELSWARSALERNPQIEVVASDAQSGVFTIRDRNTGVVEAVKLGELAAAPVSQLKNALTASAAATQAATSPEQTAAPPAETAQPESTAPAQRPENQIASTAARAATPVETKNYTIERADGQVRVSGPGISIVSSGPTATTGASDPSQHPADPIICEGRRMLHLDNRVIYVEGDAITARGGCELYITNSRIIATGTGIVVQDATVHVSNSHVEGANGSFDATDQAKMYVRSSTFQGVPKRTQLATVQDQGGNRWR